MVEHKFPHVRAMLQRQAAPGAMLLLLISAIAFMPRILDHIRGEPWVSNSIMIAYDSEREFLVEDVIQTPGAISGLRANIVEDQDGSIICASSHLNSWLGDRKQFWKLSAFASCYVTPIVPFRVCSKFTVESDSGRRRDFGPFCSPLVYPEITPNVQLQKVNPTGPQT